MRRVRIAFARSILLFTAALVISLVGACRAARTSSSATVEIASVAQVLAPAANQTAPQVGFIRVEERYPSEMHAGSRDYAIRPDGLCKRLDFELGGDCLTVQHARIPAELVPTLLAHAASIGFEQIPSDFDRGDIGFGRISLVIDHKTVEFDVPPGWRDDHAPDCETAARRAKLYAFYWRIRTAVELAIALNPQGPPLEFGTDPRTPAPDS